MDNNVKFDINLEVLGMPEVQKATTAIKAMGTLVSDFSVLVTPLTNIVKILENISLKIDKLGNVGKKSLDKVESEASEAEKGIKKVGTAAEKAGKQVKNSLFDVLGGNSFTFNNIIGAAQNIASAIAPIFEEGMMRETAATNFDTLLKKEGKDGKAYADELRRTDAAALYGTSTVNENAQAMLAYGVDSDTTMEVLTAIGDIAMGDKQKMSSLATAFSQMSALGKLQTQDWKQMVGAGFDPLKQMEEDLKLGREELDAMMAKGQITGDMVKQAFINATKEGGQFEGALKNVMDNTLQGKIAKFQGLMDDLKAKIFDLIKPLADKLLPVAGKLIEKLDCFAPVIEGLMFILAPVMDWIGENIEELMTLATAIGVVAGVIALCTSPVTGIVLAIMGLIYVLVNVIKKWNEWKETVTLIFPPLSWIIELIMSVKKHWASIVDGFRSGGILEGIKRIGLTIADALLAPIETLLELIAKIPGMENLANWVGGGVKNLRDKINDMLPEPEAKEETKETSSMDSAVAAVNSNTGGGSGSADLASATGKGKESVASGGTRNTQITINLGNMVENVNFQGGVDDNKDSLTSQLEECLLRVLYSATSAV